MLRSILEELQWDVVDGLQTLLLSSKHAQANRRQFLMDGSTSSRKQHRTNLCARTNGVAEAAAQPFNTRASHASVAFIAYANSQSLTYPCFGFSCFSRAHYSAMSSQKLLETQKIRFEDWIFSNSGCAVLTHTDCKYCFLNFHKKKLGCNILQWRKRKRRLDQLTQPNAQLQDSVVSLELSLLEKETRGRVNYKSELATGVLGQRIDPLFSDDSKYNLSEKNV